MELQNVEFFITDLIVKVNCYTSFKNWEIRMASKNTSFRIHVIFTI